MVRGKGNIIRLMIIENRRQYYSRDNKNDIFKSLGGNFVHIIAV
jgi:hypothetical protein